MEPRGYRRYHEVSGRRFLVGHKRDLEVPMSEANKALAKRWFEEVWNEGKRETIREMLAPEAVIQEGGDASVGPEGFYPFFDRMQAAFSEMHLTIHDTVTEADKVCV